MRWFRRSSATLRIESEDGGTALPFDGVLVRGGRRMRMERITGRTPFTRELRDEPVTIVVAPTALGDHLAVTYEVTRAGRVVLTGRSWWPVAVIRRQGRRVIAGGLDGPIAGDAGAGEPAVVR